MITSRVEQEARITITSSSTSMFLASSKQSFGVFQSPSLLSLLLSDILIPIHFLCQASYCNIEPFGDRLRSHHV